MNPLSLYQIEQDLAELEAALIEAGGEIDDELNARYDQLLDAREDKHRAYVAMIRRLEVSAEAVATERKRLQESERALLASAKRLKDRLCASMVAAGENVAETPLGRVRVQYGPAPVEVVVAPEELPEEFRRVVVSADAAALRAALRDGGIDLAGLARWGERSPYLRLY